jgi:methionyl-tRNA formyltransferase
VTIDIIAYRLWAMSVGLHLEGSIPHVGMAGPRVQRMRDIPVDLHRRWEDRCLDADATFLVGWSDLIPDAEIPPNCYVVHPSMLPAYRGGSPLQHQIIDGLDFGGLSVFLLQPGDRVDTGPLARQETLDLRGSLADVIGRLAYQTTNILSEMIAAIRDGNPIDTWPQGPDGFTRRRRTPAQSEITLEELPLLTARQLHDRIRALQDPYPNAFIVGADGQRVYITESRLEEQ